MASGYQRRGVGHRTGHLCFGAGGIYTYFFYQAAVACLLGRGSGVFLQAKGPSLFHPYSFGPIVSRTRCPQIAKFAQNSSLNETDEENQVRSL
jgi:hypothetical protein